MTLGARAIRRPLAAISMLTVVACGSLACGSGRDEASVATNPAAPAALSAAAPRADFSGSYRVSGTTVDKESGGARTLKGTIILSQQGTSYTSTFDLETEIPTPEGDAAHAQVVGKGEGSLEDGALRGTAQTQIVWSEVPGMNSNFAFAPRRYGPRLASTSVARMDEKGTISIEIESTGQPGESYRPTHTTLKGKRVTPGP